MNTIKQNGNDIMVKTVGKLLTAGMYVVLAQLLMGCAAFWIGAGAGALGVAFVRGDLETQIKADPRTIETAAQEALKTLEISTISANATALDAAIVGRTAADTKVTITALVQKSGDTKLTIRVGVFGNEVMSRKIYDEIQRNLPQSKNAM